MFLEIKVSPIALVAFSSFVFLSRRSGVAVKVCMFSSAATFGPNLEPG